MIRIANAADGQQVAAFAAGDVDSNASSGVAHAIRDPDRVAATHGGYKKKRLIVGSQISRPLTLR